MTAYIESSIFSLGICRDKKNCDSEHFGTNCLKLKTSPKKFLALWISLIGLNKIISSYEKQ